MRGFANRYQSNVIITGTMFVALIFFSVTDVTSFFLSIANFDVKRALRSVPSGEQCSALANLLPFLDVSENISNIFVDFKSQIPGMIEIARARQAKGDPPFYERYHPFNPQVPCNNVTSIGGEAGEDTSKLVCGVSTLPEDCVVYSIGGNDQWQFELDLVSKTACTVHTFDCTGEKTRFHVPKDDRIKFHYICIGESDEDAPEVCYGQSKCGPTMTMANIQKHLGHTEPVDLLKMDIEGFEMPLLHSWKSGHSYPQQLLMELHYGTVYGELMDDYHKEHGHVMGEHRFSEFAFEEDIIKLADHLMDLGYLTSIRNDNMACEFCTEVTMIRFDPDCIDEKTE